MVLAMARALLVVGVKYPFVDSHLTEPSVHARSCQLFLGIRFWRRHFIFVFFNRTNTHVYAGFCVLRASWRQAQRAGRRSEGDYSFACWHQTANQASKHPLQPLLPNHPTDQPPFQTGPPAHPDPFNALTTGMMMIMTLSSSLSWSVCVVCVFVPPHAHEGRCFKSARRGHCLIFRFISYCLHFLSLR